jgi:hypothetical protein
MTAAATLSLVSRLRGKDVRRGLKPAPLFYLMCVLRHG